MDDFSFSMKMRDLIKRMVKEMLDSERPRYRYAKVVSFERVARKCTIIFNGEANPVIVNMGSIQPKQANQIVRVEGIGTDKFITDVIGDAWFDPANLPDPPEPPSLPKILSGQVLVNALANAVAIHPITFTPGYFTVTPEVLVTAQSSGPQTLVQEVTYFNPTADGVEIRLLRTNDAPTTVSWLAIQMP